MKEISAGGVVYVKDNNTTRILLILDRCQKWTLPKGKIEDGETYSETALREIEEETGIKGRIIKPLDKVYYEYYHPTNEKIEKEVHYYLVEADSTSIHVQVSEINSAEWFTLEDAWQKQQTAGYENNLKVMKQSLKELGLIKF